MLRVSAGQHVFISLAISLYSVAQSAYPWIFLRLLLRYGAPNQGHDEKNKYGGEWNEGSVHVAVHGEYRECASEQQSSNETAQETFRIGGYDELTTTKATHMEDSAV